MKLFQTTLIITSVFALGACQLNQAKPTPTPTPVSQQLPPDTSEPLPLDQGSNSPVTSTMLAGSNAIFVNAQMPGDTVKINTFLLQQPGYVVIHRNNSGKPGEVIGHSGLLGTDQSQTTITLDKPTQDGDELIAMLHSDDGDGQFDITTDQPIKDDQTGDPVMMFFAVSATADDEPIVMP